MPKISRLKAGRRRPDRVNVYLDGRFAFALSMDQVVLRGWKVGTVLTDEEVGQFKAVDTGELLYAKILSYLSYRPRTIREVSDRLKRYGASEADQARFLERLEHGGYLDDTAFARWFVESRAAHRPRSRRQLYAELLAHGVGKDLAREALQGLDEAASLDALIEKRKSIGYEKLFAYLMRKGFGYSEIRAALDAHGILR